MEQYGNPVGSTDAYGNPIHQGAGGYGEHTAGGYGTAGHATGSLGEHLTGGATGVLRRSGSSSSSSSSEDDGMGGRRKKGMKEKVKEKLPSGHKKTADHRPQHYQGAAAAEQPHEKKGIVEKIKEKLPGAHH